MKASGVLNYQTVCDEVLKGRLLEAMGQGSDKRHYGHHSFRHGFITALLAAGYNEVEIADLTGHKKSNIGRTEAGKTYFHRQDVSKLKGMVTDIPIIE